MHRPAVSFARFAIVSFRRFEISRRSLFALAAFCLFSATGRSYAEKGWPKTCDRTFEPAPSAYLVDYFEEGGHKFIHWTYNRARDEWVGVEIADASGKVLAAVPRAETRFAVEGLPAGSELTVTAVTKDGKRGEPQKVALKLDSSLEVGSAGRVGIRQKDGQAEFYNKATGLVFHPCGYNYIPLRGPYANPDHSMFQAATSATTADYDPYSAEATFRLFARYGYNTVRIFLSGRSPVNPGLGGEKTTKGLYVPYLENMADFLARAGKYNVHVIFNFCDMDLPHNDYFKQRSGGAWKFNKVILSQKGLESQMEQVASTLTFLRGKNPDLLKTILGVQFNNEANLQLSKWPFDQTKPVTTANGRTYNMEDKADKMRCIEDGWIFYYSTMNGVVKKIDPEVLTCEGVFTPHGVGRDYRDADVMMADKIAKGFEWDLNNGSRLPPSLPILAKTPLDFIDIHLYPVKSMEMTKEEIREELESALYSGAVQDGLLTRKPLLAGEFGALKEPNFDSARQRIRLIRDIAVNDFHFSGFLVWAFDSFGQTTIHQAMADNGKFVSEFNDVPAWPKPSADAPIVDSAALWHNPISLAPVAATGPGQGFLVPESLPSVQ